MIVAIWMESLGELPGHSVGTFIGRVDWFLASLLGFFHFSRYQPSVGDAGCYFSELKPPLPDEGRREWIEFPSLRKLLKAVRLLPEAKGWKAGTVAKEKVCEPVEPPASCSGYSRVWASVVTVLDFPRCDCLWVIQAAVSDPLLISKLDLGTAIPLCHQCPIWGKSMFVHQTVNSACCGGLNANFP